MSTVPGSELNPAQVKAAKNLRAMRPMCVPGTDQILLPKEAHVWYEKIARVALDERVEPKQFQTFCDACGVDKP